MAQITEIAANVARVREQIASSAARAGRYPSSIRLIAVTKTFPAETIRAAYECGLREFGENRVQEFFEKLPHLHLPEARFHLIGHLQSNKVSHALSFSWIQTLDSDRLARRLNEAAAAAGKTLSVLVQVSLDDPSASHLARSGVPESAVATLVSCVATLDHLQLRGMMTLPPFTADPEDARPHFRRMRELRDRLQAGGFPQIRELSMGMTRDFPIAIEEGATMVRIGTALFGARPAPGQGASGR
ncbi:MAG: YggS family pyridoxal phosphate-dependent enzyme [Acidobacteria bacterium]|nr:YggS family pyridoxal phosphate-dependent enzyme [Acidobacteriota bacterium]